MKVGVVYVGVHMSRCLKEELAWATNKRLWVISNIMIYTTKKLRNIAVLYLNNTLCVGMWSLVTYCNCFLIILLTDAASYHH